MVKPSKGLRLVALYNNDKDKEKWVYDLHLEKDRKAVLANFDSYKELEEYVDKHEMETVDIR